MAELNTKIKLYAKQKNINVDFVSDVILQDDGNGAYINEELLAVKFADVDDYLDEDAEEWYNL